MGNINTPNSLPTRSLNRRRRGNVIGWQLTQVNSVFARVTSYQINTWQRYCQQWFIQTTLAVSEKKKSHTYTQRPLAQALELFSFKWKLLPASTTVQTFPQGPSWTIFIFIIKQNQIVSLNIKVPQEFIHVCLYIDLYCMLHSDYQNSLYGCI